MEQTEKKIVILGAGKTGRGFLARLFHDQARLTFIDRDAALIARLQNEKHYFIRYFDEKPQEEIKGYQALHTTDPACLQELAQCDALLVSVRGENCPAAADWLADKLPETTPVIVCENAVVPVSLLGLPLAERACSAAVFCTTMQAEGLNIESENYPVLHVDSTKAPSWMLSLRGIRAEADFPLLMLRKIYTYNASSAIIAYLGAEKGIQSYAQAACNPDIARELDLFYTQIDRALCLEYHIDPEEQQQFSQNARNKFENASIVDSVARNAASPERKLKPEERLLAPARLIEKHGGDASPLYKAAAAALHYMEEIIYPDDARQAIQAICDLPPENPVSKKIMRYFY